MAIKTDIKYNDTIIDSLTTTGSIEYNTNGKYLENKLKVEFTGPDDATADADKILTGYTAYIADGTKATGTIPFKTESDMLVSGATITAPAGYYATSATKSVTSGITGTPIATKGAVSNNTITVTPSVTNTSGYITGGTINGTAVTVAASELVSGSETKTANGTYDVTNLASLVVNLPAYEYDYSVMYT